MLLVLLDVTSVTEVTGEAASVTDQIFDRVQCYCMLLVLQGVTVLQGVQIFYRSGATRFTLTRTALYPLPPANPSKTAAALAMQAGQPNLAPQE